MTNTFTSAEQQAFVFNVFWVNTSWPTHQNESHSVATSSLFFKFPRPAFKISCNHCRWPRWRTPVAEENEVWHERGKRPQRWKLLKWSKNKEYKKKKHGDEASLNIVSLWSMDDFSSSTVSFSSGRISFSKCLHLDSLLCCPCALVARIAGLQHNVSSSASFLPLQTWSQPTSAALPRIIGLIFVLSAAALHSNNRLLPCVYTGTESKVGDGLLFPPLR